MSCHRPGHLRLADAARRSTTRASHAGTGATTRHPEQSAIHRRALQRRSRLSDGALLAAGGLNNPIVYSRIGTGLTVGQMITDFGRTSNLFAMAKLQASAQD